MTTATKTRTPASPTTSRAEFRKITNEYGARLGAGNYSISRSGIVRNDDTGHVLAQYPSNTGRGIPLVSLSSNGYTQVISVLREVYRAYVGFVGWDEYVLPKNGDITDVRPANLRKSYSSTS